MSSAVYWAVCDKADRHSRGGTQWGQTQWGTQWGRNAHLRDSWKQRDKERGLRKDCTYGEPLPCSKSISSGVVHGLIPRFRLRASGSYHDTGPTHTLAGSTMNAKYQEGLQKQEWHCLIRRTLKRRCPHCEELHLPFSFLLSNLHPFQSSRLILLAHDLMSQVRDLK